MHDILVVCIAAHAQKPENGPSPVVMFSAISDPAYATRAMDKGATDFWIKGNIDFAKLHQLVVPYMEGPVAV
jgi:DNA-binding NarL/FixJ family response regulator